MAASIVLGAIALGTGIYSMVKANKERKKAEAAMAANVRPELEIPSYEYDNQRLLESMAGQGMSDRARAIAQRDYERGLSSRINAITLGGGNPNDVTRAYRTYNDSVDRLALMDENIRLQNLSNLVAQNRRMGSNVVNQWQVNELGPYQDRNALYAQQIGAANQNFQAGLGMAGQGLGYAAGGMSSMNKTNRAAGGTGFLGLRKGQGTPGSIANATNSMGNTGSTSALFQPNGYDSMFSVYSADDGSVVNTLDWNRIKPENRAAIYQLYSGIDYNNGSQPVSIASYNRQKALTGT